MEAMELLPSLPDGFVPVNAGPRKGGRTLGRASSQRRFSLGSFTTPTWMWLLT